ncbi:MAG TPA: alpha/beta hydrolase [Deltaproteobacteria bacterium]|nr:alpha/beta hydrolase [Deltaproteobacteria bacterium]
MTKSKKVLEFIDPFSDEFKNVTNARDDKHYREFYEEIFKSIPTRARAAIVKNYLEYLNKSAKPFFELASPGAWGNPDAIASNTTEIWENWFRMWAGATKYLYDLMISMKLIEKSSVYYEVGRNIAVTPCEVVHETPLLKLKRYIPVSDEVYEVPLFMIYSIINAYYILDLTQELSMIRYMVEKGYDVFVTDWKLITEETKNATLEDYISEIMEAKRVIKNLTGQDKIGGLGYCIGGTYIDIDAALNDEYKYLINLTTLLNSKIGEEGAGLMGAFSDFSINDIDRFIETYNGVFPGEVLKGFFDWVKPEKAAMMFMDMYFYGNEYKYASDAVFFWNTHSTRDLAGPAHRQYLWEIYYKNSLAKGKMKLFDRKVDLKNITVPFCNVAALFDHIVPFPNALSTAYLIGTPREDQTTIKIYGGHVRGVVNPHLYPVLEGFMRKHSGKKERKVNYSSAFQQGLSNPSHDAHAGSAA